MNDTDAYVTALPATDLFADTTYQRELDVNRARTMSLQWQPRLAGVLDVADRGEDTSPRYAIINGQHRWAAAQHLDDGIHLVCNVHTGLTVDEEAQLFWDIDRSTKKLTTWDRWYARRAAGDPVVVEIEAIAADCGFRLSHNPGDKNIQACAALEWIADRCCPETIRDTLTLVTDIWPGDLEAKKSPVLKGLALVLWEYADTVHSGRLGDAMSGLTPFQLQARGHELKSRGHQGSLSKLVAIALVQQYNRRPGTNLNVEVVAA